MASWYSMKINNSVGAPREVPKYSKYWKYRIVTPNIHCNTRKVTMQKYELQYKFKEN